jgi:hypothetical protein
MNKFRNFKYNIKYKHQRAKKGYCDEDLFSIFDWFIDIFPKMLDEFMECTCGCPANTEELHEEIKNFPIFWIELQQDKINKVENKYDNEFDLSDSMTCWLLILLRLKYCFELCDEWNPYYNEYWDKKQYDELDKLVEKHKKEAFYLFEKYFFALWW